MASGGKGKKVTVGYHYYMNVHFALGHGGIDELLEIRMGDRAAWEGNLTGGDSAVISRINLFGGEKREGGALGLVDFMTGDITQPVNPSLSQAITQSTGALEIPSYRNVSTLFFKGFDGVDMTGTPWATADPGTLPADDGIVLTLTDQPALTGRVVVGSLFSKILSKIMTAELINSSFLWSAMNPYFKMPSFLVRRIYKDWYPAKAQIGDHANPIHIIYECLTNKDWGLGYPIQDVNDASFKAAADVTYNEGFGLSLKWKTQTSCQEFIELINEHINANMIEDRQTGKWRMIMVRDDYDPNTLFELNESNCTLENFQRKTMSETVNEVVASYTRLEDGETDTVTVQDLANFASTGQINSQKRDYPGIQDSELAFRVALRDLNTLSRPVAKFTIKCNRDMLGHYPGQVAKIVWPRLGLNGVVIRITNMGLGDMASGEISVEAIEDVFGLPQSAYIKQQPIGWVDSGRNPQPVNNQYFYEVSYYELYTSTDSADRLDWPADVGFVAVSAERPNNDSDTLRLYDNNAATLVADGSFTPVIELTADVGFGDTVIPVDLSTITDIVTLNSTGFAWLNSELIYILSVDSIGSTISVNRAMVDTVPATHLAGDWLWFYHGSSSVLDPTVRSAGETAAYKLIPETSRGVLPVTSASTVNYTLQNRQLLPYRPGNLKVDGEYLNAVVSGNIPLNLSWAHRDRTQEVAPSPTLIEAGNIGPEVGVTYNLEIFDENNVSRTSQTGIIDTFYDYTTEAADLNVLEAAYSGIFTVLDFVGEVTADSGFLIIGIAESGGRYTASYDKTATTDPDWAENFEQTIGDGFLRYDTDAGGNGLVVSATQIVPVFDVDQVLEIHGVNATVSPDDHTLEIEFLNDASQVVAAIKSDKDGYYQSGLWYGSSLGSLTKAPQTGSNPRTHGELEFTGSSMTFTHYTATNYNDDFTFNANFMSVTSMRVRTYAKSTYTGGSGGSAGSFVKIVRMGDDAFLTSITPSLRKNDQVRFKLESERDGLTSFQKYDVTVKRYGYGFRYGENYGGIV